MHKKWTSSIINWYSINKRNLPWRNTVNPYYIWLSEIILQQTQVQQGLPYYINFVKEFPSVFDLAKSTEEKVLKLWQGLGYYSRARNLHTSAKYIVNELNGEFPTTYSALLKLKGVGDYTASAIASISFNEVVAVVDGNVFRVLARYFGIDTPINTSQGFKVFKTLAQQLIDKKQPAEFNQAIMEFGARQCKPKSPNCTVCIFNTSCYALQHNKVEELPVKLKKLKLKHKHFNYIVPVSKNGHTFLEQRKTGIWKNLYQFPLIESDNVLTLDEVMAKTKLLDVLKQQSYRLTLYNSKTIIHKLSHQHLHTKFWVAELDNELSNGTPIALISSYPVPVLIGNFISDFMTDN